MTAQKRTFAPCDRLAVDIAWPPESLVHQRQINGLLLAFCLWAGSAVTATHAQSVCPADATGLYANGQYGYRFTVPAGLKGTSQSPCTMYQGQCSCIGDHGLNFELGGGVTLGVYSDYAADLDDPTLEDVLLAEMDRIVGKETAAPTAHITAVEVFRLKGRTGYRLRAIDTDSSSASRERVEYVFYAGMSRCIIYLSAPKGHLMDGMHTLQDVLRTWGWIPTR
jgi:hypothetical protein